MRSEMSDADLVYSPSIADLSEAVALVKPRRLLLLGGEEQHGLGVPDIRRASPPGPVVPNGLYVFRSEVGVSMLVVEGGPRPGAPSDAAWDASDEHPLIKAWNWFEFLWQSAVSIGPDAEFEIGTWVRLAGDQSQRRAGRVEGRDHVDGQWLYSVAVDGRRQTVSEAGLELLEEDDADVSSWLAQAPAGARDLSISITLAKLTNPLTDTIYSYLSSKTVFRPYQFRPVLRLLDSPHRRVLIADEVGLGKTIEAGLIWTELEARDPELRRVLIVCPSALVAKWRAEMRRRFDRTLVVLDTSGLEELVELLKADDHRRFAGIVSLERLRSSRLLADLTSTRPDFDLVIVDEAHYLRNRGTLSNELGQLLSEWADTLLFLSATPLNLGNDDLFNLLNLLVPDEFPDSAVFPLQVEPNRYLNAAATQLMSNSSTAGDVIRTLEEVRNCALGSMVTARAEYRQLLQLLEQPQLDWSALAEARRLLATLHTLSSVLTRTRKVDVPDAKAVREPIQIDVEWTPEESKFYRAVLKWSRDRATANDLPVGFVTQMPLRQAASCLPAMRELLRAKDPSLFHPMHESDFDDFELGTVDDNLGPDDLDLAAVMRAVQGLGDADTKFDRFAELLKQAPTWGRGQVLLFSFFRRTLAYLASRLSPQWSVRVMHGGTPVRERQSIMDAFRAGAFDILLTSEVASEGLDFEFCNVIVNYDLPWNPMKVEQRIGRLDRFGQEHEKIFVLNFHVPGTIETEIFERLYRRINVFHESIGELEPILRDEVNEFQRLALDPRLTEEQRQQRLSEIEVALEQRKSDLTDLEEARQLLAGIDQLMIDGFEADTTERGRFVGPKELEVLLDASLKAGTRSKLRSIQGTRTVELLGDDVLAERVSRWGGTGAGSRFNAGQLAPIIRDGDPFVMTFDNETASRNDTDLVTIRHPLIRAAVRYFEDTAPVRTRFSAVRLPRESPLRGEWLVVVHLAEATGIRPTLELWPIAVRLDDVTHDEAAGFAMLAAVADGSLRDLEYGRQIPDADLVNASRQVERLLQRRLIDVESHRRAENEALVNGRIAAQRASYAGRIDRVESTLADLRARRRDRQLLRMYEARIGNLEVRRDHVITDLETRRSLALTTHPLVAAYVVA